MAMIKDGSEQMNTTMTRFDPHLERCCEFTGGQSVIVSTKAMFLLWEYAQQELPYRHEKTLTNCNECR
jgi:hypothetical protein